MKTLSIIIPVYNEQRTIKQVLDKVRGVKLPGLNKEIIVVNDCSDDDTDKILSLEKNIKFLRHKKNLGKGAAVRTGLETSTGDLIIIQDADLEYDPKFYTLLLEPVFQNNAQVGYGSRLINYPLRFWGKDKTVLPIHLIANKTLTILTNLLYGSNLTDMETGYKLFKREVLQKISLESKRFEFEPEVTAKVLKLKIPIVEIPIKIIPRTYKEGKKIGLIDGFIAMWTLIKYRF